MTYWFPRLEMTGNRPVWLEWIWPVSGSGLMAAWMKYVRRLPSSCGCILELLSLC